MMASGRLPKPGISSAFEPRNTMYNGVNTHGRPHNPFNPTEERSTKRQKRGEDSTTSKFFAPKKLKPHDDVIEDIEQSDFKVLSEPKSHSKRSPAHEVHDLTQDESQTDALEILSVTSAGKASVAAGVSEYRNAQPSKVRPPNRRRRRRSQTPGSGHHSQNETGGPRSSHDLLAPGADSFPATSPDILSQDDPPPANVVSDVVTQPNSAKSGPANTKRIRRSVGGEGDSEDELANSHFEIQKRSTNFSKMSPPRPRQRGDMHQTEFRSSRPVSQGRTTITKLTNMPDYSEATITKAVSGKYVYPLKGQTTKEIKLRFGKGVEVAECQVDGIIQDEPWLKVQKSKVAVVMHAATRSPIIFIRRSISPGAGSMLALEFRTNEEAVCFFHWVSTNQNATEKRPDELEKMLHLAFQHAQNYLDASPQTPAHAVVQQPRARPQNQAAIQNFTGNEIHPLTEKLKNKMQGLTKDPIEEHAIPTSTHGRGVETRRTRRSSPVTQFYEPLLDRWTHKNPKWDKDWRMTLEFPANGRKRESVHKDDVARLDEGEFLNDNLINFYLRYLQAQLEEQRPEILEKVHFFNTFLFPTIKSGGGGINYKGVEKWTAKIDLFSFKYIVVPINESLHWYLAIIYNAPKLLPEADTSLGFETIDVDQDTEKTPKSPIEAESEAISLDGNIARPTVRSQSSTGTIDDASQTPLSKPPGKSGKGTPSGGPQRFSPEEPRIITLDSLGSPHPATCKALKSYLVEEAKHKKNVELLTTPGGMTAKYIPAQDNHCDCGAFLLGYMEEFLKDPDEAVRRILQKEDLGWKINASQVRTKVRDIIIKLQRDYQSGEEAKRQEKRKQRMLSKQAARSVPSSPKEPPSEISKTPQSKRDIKSPVSNSHRSPAVMKLEQVFRAQESPKPVSSAEKHPVLRGWISDKETFVHPLEDDSSNDSKTPISTEVIHSARSSPKGSTRIPVDLTTENSTHAVQDTAMMPKFVQKLPSSPLEVGVGFRGSKRSRSETPEESEVSLVRMQATGQPKSSPIPPRGLFSSQEVIPSIETEKPAVEDGPHYDGIDRSQAMEICDGNISGPITL